MNVTIKTIDTEPGVDYYSTGDATYTSLWVNPNERIAVVEQCYRDNSTPVNIWHGIELTFKINSHPKEADLREYLESAEVQGMLGEICDGHRSEWNGNNLVGKWSEETETTRSRFEQLLTELSLGDEWELWELDEWLNDVTDTITAESTNEEVAKLARGIESQARQDNVILDGDVEEYLTNLRDEMVEDE